MQELDHCSRDSKAHGAGGRQLRGPGSANAQWHVLTIRAYQCAARRDLAAEGHTGLSAAFGTLFRHAKLQLIHQNWL